MPRMNEKGQAKPIFFCCGCAVALAVAIAVGVYVVVRHLPEIALSYVGGQLQDEPLDIPVRTASEEEATRVEAKISAHLEAAAEGEAEDLVIAPEEFEILVASALKEGESPEEIAFRITAEDDKLQVQFSYEIKEGRWLNVDFTGGVRVTEGKVSLEFDRCLVGGMEIDREKLEKSAAFLAEIINEDPDAAEALSAFEKLETSGGKLRIRLRPDAAEKLLKQKKEPEPEPEPAGAEI